ncbi:uncharacterized protein LOC119092645 [Pollicipes pollicipes]|uniref:uncharacterized protein LOC119092645 n=1 Tax=Pollicipes pollicipes TaxID=41117 RepID=UPI001885416D|nr:uncharacterized protein LOC119092645 [Pollicipes pollicipes]
MDPSGSTPLTPAALGTAAPPIVEETVMSSSTVSDVCHQAALWRLCTARIQRQVVELHSVAPWYGTVYALLVIVTYVLACLILLTRAGSTLSYRGRSAVQACRVLSRSGRCRRLASRDATASTADGCSSESALASEASPHHGQPLQSEV